jgi:regulator of sigma E protease
MVLGIGEPHTFTLPPAADRGLGSAELVVRRVVPGSPADKVGLRPGDRIVSLDGRRYGSGLFFEVALSAKGLGKTSELVWERDGALLPPVQMTLAEIADPTDLQKDRKAVIHGIETFAPQGMMELVPHERRLAYAVSKAVSESTFLIWLNFKAVTGLFTGRVPLKELGGPILIGQLAARTSNEGWGYFFKLMVWLSISLGLINLLPVPILDGGQILFLGIEAVRRRPVSLRTRQVATYLGMAFILVLMVLVFKNDIERAFFG